MTLAGHILGGIGVWFVAAWMIWRASRVERTLDARLTPRWWAPIATFGGDWESYLSLLRFINRGMAVGLIVLGVALLASA